MVQLAINEKGILRGNYTDEITDNTLPVHGAVDKETQPAAWTVGGNKQTVMEAGLILQRDVRSAVERQFDDFLEQFWIRQPLFSRGRSEFDVLLDPAVRVHFNDRVVPFARTIVFSPGVHSLVVPGATQWAFGSARFSTRFRFPQAHV